MFPEHGAPSLPSLFDLQVNGFAGVDFQREDLSLPDLRKAVSALRGHRTHRILLTLITDTSERLSRKLDRIEHFRREDSVVAETVCGYHLEGPYLSAEPGYCGAHRAERMKAPDIEEFRRFQQAAGGNIRLVTLAPEWNGSAPFIREVTAEGVVVSLGHTAAEEEDIDRAIQAGATLCTHLGNGCPGELDRHDNIIQRLLSRDELTACFIPDGIHIPPSVLRNYFRAKPKDKVILTTDCMAAAGAPPGRYTIGEHTVEVGEDRVVRQPGKTNLAGSSLALDDGVDNACRWLGLPVDEAWSLASISIAKIFRIELPDLDHA